MNIVGYCTIFISTTTAILENDVAWTEFLFNSKIVKEFWMYI